MMPNKRQRSPSPSAPRHRTPSHAIDAEASTSASASAETTGFISHDASLRRHTIADLFPYQELFLRVLSFLSPTELAQIQGVSKYWSRMALDPQLWKRLYLSRYPHPHHSKLIYKPQSDRKSTPSRLRPIARLPSRAFPPPLPSRSPSATPIVPSPSRSLRQRTPPAVDKSNTSSKVNIDPTEVGYGVRNDGVDWKMMLRLGTNWSNGNALSQNTIALPPSPSPSRASPDAGAASSRPPPYSEQHIALFPSFIFTSNPNSPLVHVHHSTSNPSAVPLGILPPPPGWSSPHRPDNVTAICADQSVALPDDPTVDRARSNLPARLAIFYQSGGFAVLRVCLEPGNRINWIRESIYPPQTRLKSIRRRATSYSPLDGDPIVLATMHFPLLLTCTLGFHISAYGISETLSGTQMQPKHLSTMHSDVSFHPAALSLLPIPEESSYRAALTYCTPLYPRSWTVAVQEFAISHDLSEPSVTRGESYHVGRGDEPEDDEIWPRRVKPVIGVKGHKAVGIGTDGRWCVLAGEDNRIQVYSLPTPSPSPPPRTSPILHAQTLLAHSANVTSISLSAGRCVSGSKDGRVLVWDLDDESDIGQDTIGRTVGYVEVKQGGRRWKGPSGPMTKTTNTLDEGGLNGGDTWDWPHPASISSAARSLFLPRPPDLLRDERPPSIRQLVFDEEKIVGLVKVDQSSTKHDGDVAGDVMRVWSFNG